MNKLYLMLPAVMLLVLSCGGNQESVDNKLEDPIAVQVGQATRGNMTIYKKFTGTIEGIEQALLTAKIPGTVVEVRIHPGESVRADDVLLKLDESGSSSGIEQAEAYYSNAKKTLNRMKHLFDEGAISEQQYNNAETSFKVAEANFKTARNMVKITSPISGIVTELKVNVGDQTFPGQKLVTVSRVDSLRLKFGADSEDIENLNVGDTATVYPVGEKDNTIQGVVTRVARSADPMTRAFDVEVSISNKNDMLRPGDFAGCAIALKKLSDIVMVPDDAIVLSEGMRKIFVVRSDTATIVPIATGESSEGYTQILSGVNTGDTVVTVGQGFLEDKTYIKATGAEASTK